MPEPLDFDITFDFSIHGVALRPTGGGSWVFGKLADHLFEALVFPQHALLPEYELGRSRIAKLCLRRASDRQPVLDWDRGWGRRSTSPQVQAIVDFLASGLADCVYPQ